jgi:hypothetical protein
MLPGGSHHRCKRLSAGFDERAAPPNRSAIPLNNARRDTDGLRLVFSVTVPPKGAQSGLRGPELLMG